MKRASAAASLHAGRRRCTALVRSVAAGSSASPRKIRATCARIPRRRSRLSSFHARRHQRADRLTSAVAIIEILPAGIARFVSVRKTPAARVGSSPAWPIAQDCLRSPTPYTYQRLFSSASEDSWRRDSAGASVHAEIQTCVTKCSERWATRMIGAAVTFDQTL